MLLVACDGGVTVNAGSHDHSHSADAVSGVRDGYWPPEPTDIEEQRLVPTAPQARARESVIDIARRSVANNPAVQAAIGERHGSSDASLSSSKNEGVASFVFYNYDTDRTVEAVLAGDGAVAVSTFAASERQPTENGAEVARAISLARAALEADGNDLDGLQGTAMLTYPAATPGGGAPARFHDTRVLYATFGPGDGELPHYSARVDIGTGTVSEAGAIR